MRWTLLVLVLGALTSLGFVVKLQPDGIGNFVYLAAWLTLPYALMAGLLFVLRHRAHRLLPWCITAALVTAGGLYLQLDAIFLHPDPQSAIGVLLTPVLQAVGFLLIAPLATWITRHLQG